MLVSDVEGVMFMTLIAGGLNPCFSGCWSRTGSLITVQPEQ